MGVLFSHQHNIQKYELLFGNMCYYLIYINVELIDDIIIIAITLIISIINIPSVLRLILIQPIIQWIPYCSLQLHNCSVGAQELCGLQG